MKIKVDVEVFDRKSIYVEANNELEAWEKIIDAWCDDNSNMFTPAQLKAEYIRNIYTGEVFY